MIEFDCQICFELYEVSGTRQPCVIDCGHTLCYDCVSRLKSLRRAARCPFCLSSIVFQKEFPKNYSLLDAMSAQMNNLICETDVTETKKSTQTTAIVHGDEDRDGDNSASPVQSKGRKLLEKTLQEYKDEKLLLERNHTNLTNYTALLNQTRSQLTLLEQLTRQAQQEFDTSQSKLEDLKSVLRYLQLSSKDGSVDLPADIPTIVPEDNTVSTLSLPSADSFRALSDHIQQRARSINEGQFRSRVVPPPHPPPAIPSRIVNNTSQHVGRVSRTSFLDEIRQRRSIPPLPPTPPPPPPPGR